MSITETILHAKDHLPTVDARLEIPAGSFSYEDSFTDEIAHMRRVQLLDRSAWRRFVQLFKETGADDGNLGWRCEYWGKMMRGACFVYKCAPGHDAELYAVLEETVRDMLTAADDLGRISTYTVEQEFQGWDIWGRKYIMLGFLYFLEICRDEALAEQILPVLTAHADYIVSHMGTAEEGKRVLPACSHFWDGLNCCSIMEPYVLLYNLTKEPRYLAFAEYILSFGGTLHQNLFDLAYEDKTPIHQFRITKAYEMISCFEGLAEYAKITGNAKAKETVIRFADRVLKEETTIIGCLGCEFESFDHAVIEQFNESHRSEMQETCVTVTWMKFLWQLWRMTGDVKYMDALEISAYNAMSASIRRHVNPADNGGLPLPVHSYNPLRHDVRPKTVGGGQFIAEGMIYGCCVCISTAGFALDTLASAGTDQNGTVYVNLYRNGTFTASGLTVTMETDYPVSGTVRFSVKGAGKLAIRIPAWAKSASLTKADNTCRVDSGYCFLDVVEGDTFTLDLPMAIRFVHPADVADVPTDVDYYVAVYRGPVLYAADDTLEEEPVYAIDEASPCTFTKTDSLAGIPCRSTITLSLQNGETLSLMDYASAGQEDGHKVSAWIKTR